MSEFREAKELNRFEKKGMMQLSPSSVSSIPLHPYTRSTNAFPQKLYALLQNETMASAQWFEDGKGFYIVNLPIFEKQTIPKYFKQKKIRSFFRQLNVYGFVRCFDHFSRYSFRHPYFVKNRPELLTFMERRKPLSTRKIRSIEKGTTENTGICPMETFGNISSSDTSEFPSPSHPPAKSSSSASSSSGLSIVTSFYSCSSESIDSFDPPSSSDRGIMNEYFSGVADTLFPDYEEDDNELAMLRELLLFPSPTFQKYDVNQSYC